QKYDLYDFVIVGVVNEDHPDGIFNVDTLTRIDRLTKDLLYLRQGENGLPEIQGLPGKKTRQLDLRPTDNWSRLLNRAFNHDPNQLFDEQGHSVIIGREIIAPS
ncbi:MAG: hypothetical protein GWN87_25245, partial [Desulfuromonadales bacterium]|nr:hypothetical protein [Desulfuromonadales bacterium]NIS43112.1 hypothetical protein [Desulfuromonadales bacterium]